MTPLIRDVLSTSLVVLYYLCRRVLFAINSFLSSTSARFFLFSSDFLINRPKIFRATKPKEKFRHGSALSSEHRTCTLRWSVSIHTMYVYHWRKDATRANRAACSHSSAHSSNWDEYKRANCKARVEGRWGRDGRFVSEQGREKERERKKCNLIELSGDDELFGWRANGLF